MDMNPKSPALRIGSGSAPLVNSDAGHYAIDLKPESRRAIYDAHASFAMGTTTLPGRLRTRSRPGPASSATLATSRCTAPTPEPAHATTRRLPPALLQSALVCAAVCASSTLGSDRGDTSHDMFTTSIPCASRYYSYYAQSRGQFAQRVTVGFRNFIFWGPRLWHIEIRPRVKKAFAINLFGFEVLILKIRRFELWKPTVWPPTTDTTTKINLTRVSAIRSDSRTTQIAQIA